MKPCRLIFSYALLVASLLALAACSSDSGGGGGTTVTDSGAPAATTATQVFLTPAGTIVVTFDQAMDPASNVLGGSLASSASGAWSTGTKENDTLTITPQSAWPVGHSQTLTVTAKSTGGETVSNPPSLKVEVFDQFVYVDGTNGDDGNAGTSAAPFKTIAPAVTAADALISGGKTMVAVLVSVGAYTVDSGSTTEIELVGGVSLYGGFSTGGWTTRSTTATPSIVTDTATIIDCVTYPNYNCAIVVNNAAATPANTMIDGFKVIPAIVDTVTYGVGIDVGVGGATVNGNTIAFPDTSGKSFGIFGILAEGPAPGVVITNNEVTLGTHGTTGTNLYGIGIGLIGVFDDAQVAGNRIGGGIGFSYHGIYFWDTKATTISNNTVTGAGSGHNGISYGLYISGSASTTDAMIERNHVSGGTSTGDDTLGALIADVTNLTIENNVIVGGIASSSRSTWAVWLDTVTGAVQNNTIYGGTGGQVTGMFILGGSSGSTIKNITPKIENNILIGGTGVSTSYCAYETDANSDPVTFKHNAFHQCATSVYYNEGSANLANAAAVDALDAAYSGNVEADPGFADAANGDYHLTASSPASVRTGGLDLSANILNDADGKLRTVPFSIGAYEQD